jgi:hypothetical protein
VQTGAGQNRSFGGQRIYLYDINGYPIMEVPGVLATQERVHGYDHNREHSRKRGSSAPEIIDLAQ